MTTVAKTEVRDAFLWTEFGEQFARRIFPDQVDTLPRFTKGKRVGKIKGKIRWRKVVSGGWHYKSQSVLRPGRTYDHGLFETDYAKGDKLVAGVDAMFC